MVYSNRVHCIETSNWMFPCKYWNPQRQLWIEGWTLWITELAGTNWWYHHFSRQHQLFASLLKGLCQILQSSWTLAGVEERCLCYSPILNQHMPFRAARNYSSRQGCCSSMPAFPHTSWLLGPGGVAVYKFCQGDLSRKNTYLTGECCSSCSEEKHGRVAASRLQ